MTGVRRRIYTKIYASGDPIARTHAMLCAFRRPAVKVECVATRGQRPGIVLAVRTPGGDRETQEYETRCPPGGAHTGFVTRVRRNRIASRERTNRLSLVGGFPPEATRRDQAGARGASGANPFFSPCHVWVDRSHIDAIMLALRGLLVIAACRVTAALPPVPAKAVYDQRQTGDLNVQIELKDLQVIALLKSELLDDYTDYDYFYDYADFTIKPGNRPTTSSTTGTTEKNDITQVSEPSPSQNSTVPASVDNTSPATSDTTLSKGEGAPNADPLNGTASSTPNADNDDDKNQPSEEEDRIGTAPSTTVKPVHALRSQKRCRSGYVPTGDGRCRRASRPWLTRLLP